MTNEKRISYSISTREYDRNKDEKATNRLTWREKQGISIKDLEYDITSGFAYCPTFYHKGDTFTNRTKTQKNLKATYFITFDFDAVKLTASEFYGKMICTEIPPSLVYTTANNGKFKTGKNETYNNRYRVIYALDEPITSSETYTELHQALKDEIATIVDDNSLFNDNTDKDVSHFFAGCTNAETYSNTRTTPLTWLADRYNVDITDNKGIRIQYNDNHFSNDRASASPTERTNTNDKCIKTYSWVDIKKEREQYSTRGDVMTLFSDFINDYLNTDKNFKRLSFEYSRILPRLPEETPVTFDEGKLYKVVDENHIKILHKRHKVTKRAVSGNEIELWEPIKFKDGQNRKDKLYAYLQMLKGINPSATFEELLWMGTNFIVEQVDNTKDPITKNYVISTVNNVLKREWHPSEESKEKYRVTLAIDYKLARLKGIKKKVVGLVAAHQCKTDLKLIKWEKISKLYDPSKTDKANAQMMNEAGVEVSVQYLRNWKSANGYTKTKKAANADRIGTYYDNSLTDNQNLEKLAVNGVKVSLSTLKRWKKENGYTKQRIKDTEKQNKAATSIIGSEDEDMNTENVKTQQGANME